MFKDFEKLTKRGTVIFGNSNTTDKNIEFFCFWQPKGAFYSTQGLLENLELNDFGDLHTALENCECIPFGRGSTPFEAYDNMLSVYNRAFDEDGDWVVMDYDYNNDFLFRAKGIDGYIDFLDKDNSTFVLFQELESYEKSCKKYVDIIIQKYNEFKSIEKVQNYFKEEYDYTISSSMIEKNLEYIYKNESTMILSPMASGKTNEKQTSNF